MPLFSNDTVTITRPDYAEPWSAQQVIPILTVGFAILGTICIAGTGFLFVAVFFELLAKMCWTLVLIGVLYTIWQNRYVIRYLTSKSKYKCLLSPEMREWFYQQNIYSLDGKNSRVCKVPVVQLMNDSFKIKVLAGTLQTLTDTKFASEIEAYMIQHGCDVSVLPGQRRGGYVEYSIRPDIRRDRLHYVTRK